MPLLFELLSYCTNFLVVLFENDFEFLGWCIIIVLILFRVVEVDNPEKLCELIVVVEDEDRFVLHLNEWDPIYEFIRCTVD